MATSHLGFPRERPEAEIEAVEDQKIPDGPAPSIEEVMSFVPGWDTLVIRAIFSDIFLRASSSIPTWTLLPATHSMSQAPRSFLQDTGRERNDECGMMNDEKKFRIGHGSLVA